MFEFGTLINQYTKYGIIANRGKYHIEIIIIQTLYGFLYSWDTVRMFQP